MPKIITIYDDNSSCLKQNASPIELTETGLKEASYIVEQLMKTVLPIMPIAGLAAPQIGISKQVFIYSFDRTSKNMTAAINPIITKYGDEKVGKWEVCLSSVDSNDRVKAAYLERPYYIEVEYFDILGQRIKKSLEGFAAKLFQHEYDHLQGIVCIDKEGSIIQEFIDRESLNTFTKNLGKNNDYIEPRDL